jgi:predicted phosphohydrolase
MRIFAIADLHLSFGAARADGDAAPVRETKPMDIFGAHWRGHAEKIAAAWRRRVGVDDVVAVAGDFSWAMKLRDAAADFAWLRALPGHKVLIRGNHDFWWDSLSKNQGAGGEKIHFIHNTAVVINGVAFAGSRLWNFPEIKWQVAPEFYRPTVAAPQNRAPHGAEKNSVKRGEDDAKICQSELHRLQTSLAALPPEAKLKIALTHFPPLSALPQSNALTAMLGAAGVDFCVYGHEHGLLPRAPIAGAACELDGTRYRLTAADYLDFDLLELGDGNFI